MLENIINSSKENLNKVYKNLRHLTYYGLISLMIGCGGDKPGPVEPPIETPTNKPPETWLIRPTNNQIFNTNSVIAEWNGSDEDGTVVDYHWYYQVGGTVTDGFHNGNIKTFTNLEEGNYRFGVQARDDDGALDPTSDEIHFTIQLQNIGPSDNTNTNGYVQLEVGSSVFDVYVYNESNQPLNNIKVSGNYYEGNIYGFLAEDFSGNYLSNIYYTGGFGKVAEPADHINLFMKAKWQPKIQERQLPTFTDIRNNPDFTYICTSPISDLQQPYTQYDAIFQDKSLLEFLANITGYQAFIYAYKAAEFREWFINQGINTISSLINEVASLIGYQYDPDAYYVDLYSHNFVKVFRQEPNQDKLCTLKGRVYNSTNNQNISSALVSILSGPYYANNCPIPTRSTNTNSSGEYILKFLPEGTFTIKASASNYQDLTQTINIVAPTPPFYNSTRLSFPLSPIGTQPDTTIIQPEDGKDSFVEALFEINNPNPIDNYNINRGNSTSLTVEHDEYGNNYYAARSYIEFNLSSIQNRQIKSAKLKLYGFSAYGNQFDIEIRRVLGSWNESSITWANQPGFSNNIETTTQISTTTSRWYEFDVTNLVKNWKAGTYSNYGLVLKLTQASDSGNKIIDFYSSDNTILNINVNPTLEVVYQ